MESEQPTFRDGQPREADRRRRVRERDHRGPDPEADVGATSYSAGYPIKTFAPVLVVESGGQPFLGALKATGPVDAGGRLRDDRGPRARPPRPSCAPRAPPTRPRSPQFYLGTDGRDRADAAAGAADRRRGRAPPTRIDQADALARLPPGQRRVHVQHRRHRFRRIRSRTSSTTSSSIRPTARWASASTTPPPWWSWPARSASRPGWRSDTRRASRSSVRTLRRMRRPRRSGRSGRRTPMPGPSSTSPATAGRCSRRPSRSAPSSGCLARRRAPGSSGGPLASGPPIGLDRETATSVALPSLRADPGRRPPGRGAAGRGQPRAATCW